MLWTAYRRCAAGSPVSRKNVAPATVDAAGRRPGETLRVDISYQRDVHWSRLMAEPQVVDAPFRLPPPDPVRERAERQVEQEDPLPGPLLDDERSEGRAGDARDRPDRAG